MRNVRLRPGSALPPSHQPSAVIMSALLLQRSAWHFCAHSSHGPWHLLRASLETVVQSCLAYSSTDGRTGQARHSHRSNAQVHQQKPVFFCALFLLHLQVKLKQPSTASQDLHSPRRSIPLKLSPALSCELASCEAQGIDGEP